MFDFANDQRSSAHDCHKKEKAVEISLNGLY